MRWLMCISSEEIIAHGFTKPNCTRCKFLYKENLSKDLSMVVLGDYVGLNPAYLSRIYKETAGQSINSYISDQRTVLAKKLLKDPTIKIQKIAEMTGMRTASYFTHYFKKYVGISPQEYRNQ